MKKYTRMVAYRVIKSLSRQQEKVQVPESEPAKTAPKEKEKEAKNNKK